MENNESNYKPYWELVKGASNTKSFLEVTGVALALETEVIDGEVSQMSAFTLNEWCREFSALSKAKGFQDGEKRKFGEVLMLIVSELSEALEEYRGGKELFYLVNGKPEGIKVEMADALIRIMDHFGTEGWDLEEVVRLKHNYNKTRSYRHGGKVI